MPEQEQDVQPTPRRRRRAHNVEGSIVLMVIGVAGIFFAVELWSVWGWGHGHQFAAGALALGLVEMSGLLLWRAIRLDADAWRGE